MSYGSQDDRKYADHFFEILEDTVRRRMPTDSPVASELSGGLDSSSITAVARHVSSRQGREIGLCSGICGPE